MEVAMVQYEVESR